MGFISISNSERCELDFSLVSGIYGHYINTLIYHLNQAILTSGSLILDAAKINICLVANLWYKKILQVQGFRSWNFLRYLKYSIFWGDSAFRFYPAGAKPLI
jgi:hypothetical protein